MKKICFINGSPRGNESSSLVLINELDNMLDHEEHSTSTITVTTSIGKNLISDFNTILDSHVLIIAFPLYYYALPGLLTRFLEEYYQYAQTMNTNHKTKVYAVINCGFPEAFHNDHAAQIIDNFSSRLHFEWRFALEIGAGGILAGTKNIPMKSFLKKNIYNGLTAIATDIKKPSPTSLPNYLAEIRFPNWLYRFQGNRNWITMAKQNGLTRKELAKAPHTQ